MNPPVECGACNGRGWHNRITEAGGRLQVISCVECGGTGWTLSVAVWHCMIGADRLTCNPKRQGAGHTDCGWFVPLSMVLDQESQDALL